MRTARAAVVIAPLVSGLLLSSCTSSPAWTNPANGIEDRASTSTVGPASPTPSPRPNASDGQRENDSTGPDDVGKVSTPTRVPEVEHVVAISIDGLGSRALEFLGRADAPAIWRLIDAGAATLDARTAAETTVTLPNHVGMVTGRPVGTSNGGHGVDFNGDRAGAVVPGAQDGDVASIFTLVHESGGTSSVFAGKVKFDLFDNSWPAAINRSTIELSLARLSDDVARDLREQRSTFTFVHVGDADEAGHRAGWMSPTYLDAVRDADALVGRVLRVIQRTKELRDTTAVVLTADHGGEGRAHGDIKNPANFTIPFLVAGPGVPTGDIYEMWPGVTNPGDQQVGYAGVQPVRNCDVANVAGVLLGLGMVPDSRCVAATDAPLGQSLVPRN